MQFITSRFPPFIIAVALLALSASPMRAATAAFNWRTDTIAFSNDTVFAYGIDEAGHLTMHRREKPARFAHRCFVLVRAVLQFHKFARFDPSLPRVSEDQYASLIRRVCRIPIWMPAPARLIVIPGYRNLNDFSHAHENVLKQNIGNWFPTYLRFGNWRMIGPFPRFGQANAYAQLTRGLDRGKLQAVYLTRFPKMNHCVILFDYHSINGGRTTRFDAYDPNYPNTLSWVEYDATQRSFNFERRWFWPGGRVNLMRVYLSPIH
jgi:hypothetical protein